MKRKTEHKRFVTADDLHGDLAAELLSGKTPVVFSHPLGVPRVSPGTVSLLGAGPGVGKTSLVVQMVIDMLITNPSLKVLMANVEMSPLRLLERAVVRLGKVHGGVLRDRILDDAATESVNAGLDELEPILPRLAFLQPPFSMENVAYAGDEHECDLVVLDYLQRFSPTKESAESEGRQRMNALMNDIRRCALEAGVAVFAVAAVGRQRTKDGAASGYTGLQLSSFRDSGELEYGADEAYMIEPLGDRSSNRVRLEHLKCRDGELRSVNLQFDRALQTFTLDDDQGEPSPEPAPPRGARPGSGGGRRRAAEERADATDPELLKKFESLRKKNAGRGRRGRKADQPSAEAAEQERRPSEAEWNSAMKRAVSSGDTEGRGDDSSDTQSDAK